MAVYDTPINTDSAGLPRLIDSGLPVLLFMYDTPAEKLDVTLREAAEDFAGDMLVARVNVAENPDVHEQYGALALPALVTIDGELIESQAARVRSEDIDDHVMFLMGQGPKPQETAAERDDKGADGTGPMHTSDADFKQDVLESDVPVLVDFWAPWCGPCHRIAPVLEELAGEYAGKARIAKLNVDENPATAQAYQVRGIPMLLMFDGGDVVGKLVGAHPRPSIQKLLDEAT